MEDLEAGDLLGDFLGEVDGWREGGRRDAPQELPVEPRPPSSALDMSSSRLASSLTEPAATCSIVVNEHVKS